MPEEEHQTIDEVIEPIEGSWRRFREALAALPPDGFDRRTRAGWTVKEMLGHVAFWAETVEPVVEGMFRGQPVSEGW